MSRTPDDTIRELNTEIRRLVSAIVEIRSTLWRGFEQCDPDAVISKAYSRAHKLASDALNGPPCHEPRYLYRGTDIDGKS